MRRAMLTGYGAKTLPGVREAIERPALGPRLRPTSSSTAKVLDAYTARVNRRRGHALTKAS